MKMSAVKNFTFISLHAFPFIYKFFYYLLSFVSVVSYLLYTQISAVIQRFTTSEDVSWNIRNVKIKPVFFPEMRLYFLMFITAVCFLFLLKLRWPKNKLKVSTMYCCSHDQWGGLPMADSHGCKSETFHTPTLQIRRLFQFGCNAALQVRGYGWHMQQVVWYRQDAFESGHH